MGGQVWGGRAGVGREGLWEGRCGEVGAVGGQVWGGRGCGRAGVGR